MAQDDALLLAFSSATVSFKDDVQSALCGYWRQLRGSGAAAPAKAFKLHDLPNRCIPNVALFDVLPGASGQDAYYCRFWGTELARVFKFELGRKPVTEFPSKPCMEHAIRLLDCIVEQAKPVYAASQFCFHDRPYLVAERTAVPLINEAGEVVQVATVQTFTSTAGHPVPPAYGENPGNVWHVLDYLCLDDDDIDGRLEGQAERHSYDMSEDDPVMKKSIA